MSNELLVQEFEPIVKQSGLEKAEQYAAVFAPFMINLKQLSDKAATINKVEPSALDAKLAREVRLAMAKNRTATEKQKDLSKSALLAEGNVIQNLSNLVVNTSKLVEADLDAVEKYAENKEKERKAALAVERSAVFIEYGTDLTGYDLGSMSDQVFSDLLESQKLLHEKRIAEAARLEAERIAAEKAELERQAALKAENDRLKKEQEDAAAALEAERTENARLAKIEADKQAVIEKENAKKLAAIEAENNRIREKADAELKEAKRLAEVAQAELQAKKEAERKAELEKIEAAKQAEASRLAAEKKAAKAPIKIKLKTAINGLVLELPESEITADIQAKFNGFKSWALQQVEAL